MLYWVCNYISMLGLKLNHVSKRGPGWQTDWRKHLNWKTSKDIFRATISSTWCCLGCYIHKLVKHQLCCEIYHDVCQCYTNKCSTVYNKAWTRPLLYLQISKHFAGSGYPQALCWKTMWLFSSIVLSIILFLFCFCFFVFFPWVIFF